MTEKLERQYVQNEGFPFRKTLNMYFKFNILVFLIVNDIARDRLFTLETFHFGIKLSACDDNGKCNKNLYLNSCLLSYVLHSSRVEKRDMSPLFQ